MNDTVKQDVKRALGSETIPPAVEEYIRKAKMMLDRLGGGEFKPSETVLLILQSGVKTNDLARPEFPKVEEKPTSEQDRRGDETTPPKKPGRKKRSWEKEPAEVPAGG